MSDAFTSIVALHPSGSVKQEPSKTAPSQHTQKRGLYENRRQGPLIGSTVLQRSGHILDASTFSLWRLDEALASASAVDAVGLRHLTPSSPAPAVVPGRIGNARAFNGTSNFFSGGGDAASRTALLGEWTVETWIYPTDLTTRDVVFFAYQPLNGYVPGDPTKNVLVQIGVKVGGKIRTYWQYGSGPTGMIGDQINGANVPVNAWTHLAVRKRFASGTLYHLDFFHNGVFQDTHLNAENCTGGQDSLWYLGSQHSTSSFMMVGNMDDVRFSNVPRTNAEILDSFNRGSWS